MLIKKYGSYTSSSKLSNLLSKFSISGLWREIFRVEEKEKRFVARRES
jgi:hypothetical protein